MYTRERGGRQQFLSPEAPLCRWWSLVVTPDRHRRCPRGTKGRSKLFSSATQSLTASTETEDGRVYVFRSARQDEPFVCELGVVGPGPTLCGHWPAGWFWLGSTMRRGLPVVGRWPRPIAPMLTRAPDAACMRKHTCRSAHTHMLEPKCWLGSQVEYRECCNTKKK